MKRTPAIVEEEIVEKEIKEPEVKKNLSKLKKLLPTKENLEEVTLRTIWKYADK